MRSSAFPAEMQSIEIAHAPGSLDEDKANRGHLAGVRAQASRGLEHEDRRTLSSAMGECAAAPTPLTRVAPQPGTLRGTATSSTALTNCSSGLSDAGRDSRGVFIMLRPKRSRPRQLGLREASQHLRIRAAPFRPRRMRTSQSSVPQLTFAYSLFLFAVSDPMADATPVKSRRVVARCLGIAAPCGSARRPAR